MRLCQKLQEANRKERQICPEKECGAKPLSRDQSSAGYYAECEYTTSSCLVEPAPPGPPKAVTRSQSTNRPDRRVPLRACSAIPRVQISGSMYGETLLLEMAQQTSVATRETVRGPALEIIAFRWQ